MQVLARDLWTGDIVVRHAGTICSLQYIDGGPFPDMIEVVMAHPILTRDPQLPIEFIENKTMRYRAVEQVEVWRDRPLPNGMHMTQFDCQGKCHGRAHPELEAQLRAEGRMA